MKGNIFYRLKKNKHFPIFWDLYLKKKRGGFKSRGGRDFNVGYFGGVAEPEWQRGGGQEVVVGGAGGRWGGEKASKAAYQQVAAALRLSSPTPPACGVVDSLLILTGVLSRRSGEIKNCQHVNKHAVIEELKLKAAAASCPQV